MVNDALKLTVDNIFWPKKGMQPYEQLNVFEVPEYDSNQNMWDLVVHLHTVTLPVLNKNQPVKMVNVTPEPE